MVSNINHEAPLGKSDHCCLKFNCHCYTTTTAKSYVKYYYDQARIQGGPRGPWPPPPPPKKKKIPPQTVYGSKIVRRGSRGAKGALAPPYKILDPPMYDRGDYEEMRKDMQNKLKDFSEGNVTRRNTTDTRSGHSSRLGGQTEAHSPPHYRPRAITEAEGGGAQIDTL